MPQRGEALLYETCIVHALPMTLRIFFCLDLSFSPLKVENRWGEQQNQTYVYMLISNFSFVVHSLMMNIVKFVRFV